jgi:hypothetical protein
MEYQKKSNFLQNMKKYHEIYLEEYQEVKRTKQAMANRDMKAMAASAARGKELARERGQILQGFPAWLITQWMINVRPVVKPFGLDYQPMFLFKLKEWMTGGDIRAARGRKLLEEMHKAKQKGKPATKEEDSSKD